MREKLLIVDDEPGIVEMMASYFAPQYQVLTAHSGAEALEKAGEGPDLILLDINMPGMDGLTVSRYRCCLPHRVPKPSHRYAPGQKPGPD